MDLNLLHVSMELFAVACLFCIAWLNIRYKATGIYSHVMALGLSFAGVADLVHAIVPYFYPELSTHWMAASWGAGRLTLIITFLMVFLCYDVVKCQAKNIIIILSFPMFMSIFVLAASAMGSLDLSWTYAEVKFLGLEIHRPFDFVLLLLWSTTALILRSKSQILFPPNVYWIFMSQGVIVHAIMSFTSCESLDTGVFVAHGLKISEYYSFILIYLMYKARLDNMPKKSCLDNPKGININRMEKEKSVSNIHHSLGTR